MSGHKAPARRFNIRWIQKGRRVPYLLYVFPTPADARCELRHDTAGWSLTATPAVHPSGRPGQVFTIPDTTPQDNGAALLITAPKKVPLELRAILHLGPETYLRCDDFHLADAMTSLPRLVVSGTVLKQDLA
jgi:hypothetical protein